MIPLRDNIPSRTTPFVNYGVIAVCTIAFLGQLSASRRGDVDPVERYGMIPGRVLNPDVQVKIQEPVIVRTGSRYVREIRERPAAPSAVAPALTLLTCIFLHGGWMHFLGNM